MSEKVQIEGTSEKAAPTDEHPLPVVPEVNANIVSRIVFWWLNSLMLKGYKRPLEKEDLYDLGAMYNAENLSTRFEDSWRNERLRPKPSLFHALHVTFGRRFWPAGILKFLGDLAQTVSPLFVREITNYVRLLIDTLGPSALAGFAILVIFGPLQGYIMRKLAVFRRRAAAVTDQRVKATQEVLQGIKVIKFFAWEESFGQKLSELRNQELISVRKLLIIRALIFSAALVVPVFASILSFVVYYLAGNELTPGVVFSSVALFNVLRLPLMLFPAIIGFTVDAKVSLGRIQELLLAPELDTLPPIEHSADFGVRVENGKFMWESPPPEEEDPKKKKRRMKEEKKNKKKTKTKSVKNDLKQAENSDEGITVENTIIDDKNSGEAKDSAAPFLRDINFSIPKGKLVAVVGSVGSGKSSLLNALVGEMRMVEGSITFGGRVGYCPQTAWIQNATLKDNIIFGLPFNEERYKRVLHVCALERDLEVLPGGDYTEIGERGINLSGGQKQRLNIARAVYFDSDIILLDDPLSAVDAHVGKHLFDKCIVGELAGKTRLLVTHQLHYIRHCDYVLYLNDGRITEQGTYQELMNNNNSFAKLLQEYGGIDEEEEEEEGGERDADQSSNSTIIDESPKPPVVTEVPTKGAAVAAVRAPGLMTTEERSTGAVNSKVYMLYFAAGGGLVALSGIIVLLILTQVVRVGNDLWLSYWSEEKWGLSKQLYMGVYVAWGVGQSIFMLFFGTLNGLATIRAYRVQDRFTRTNEKFMNGNNRPYYLSISIQRWLGVRLETIANILTFFATVFAVLARGKVAPGQVGLVLSYSLQVTGVFNWCVRQAAEVETNMNAVERVDHYIHNIESEADLVIGDRRPEPEWPQRGDIEIKDLELSYREGLPPVLHGINLSITGGEKVGVVGRTGAGKSSIMIALFRVVEASRGSIDIDGIDISSIGLHDLRSKLAIIPQDPVLFTGTVRSNLDPFNNHTDQELWDVLGRADLKTYFSTLPSGLESDITEGGENLSAGQRQLLCLARAMLTRSRIVIMDEATASVDVQTDALIQKALRVDFAQCTVLTIAHRLNTVIDYDKILVLDNGNVKEFDSPKNLLSDVNSAFYSMVQETGPANAALLMSLAK
ncbi:P-loop containing nucleoside triphosphate hydrolase protein [Basidiobolus meristosporus CBS 931.73]|uniref:p-loop containing nucleoside triphosphate hydrolase protein n=1 Tax=Basidiobolus meristosporus CBS 931.73 TaxID=1314790 RepID=A0A1Y1XB19_9FUNG|nr:P-loop containing nucleoside triphosphate hydrolase protein [Basidiobolus meristosporus CBS 931.73]|eukprot:ORX82952.1 P-loop containing nucleoside triphosphate hydrolase protein [Basidiobolus meristosporus CBS 931.73]